MNEDYRQRELRYAIMRRDDARLALDLAKHDRSHERRTEAAEDLHYWQGKVAFLQAPADS